ncbi:MAG: hypothetical protein RBS77_02880 [Candidatus Moranbacteria bacterium]|jgi:hypothetical protein|nr:hypothetical protein [Candidatus Moranbacteria bacterium]
MDEKNENKNEKKSNKKMVIGLVILLFFLLIPAVVFLGKFSQPENDANTNELISEEDVLNNDNDEKKEVENIEMNNADSEVEEKEMVSENYRVSQVKFGGNVVIENGKSRDTKLEIYQVKSENILSQEDNEPSILISWKTNKEAISNIDYAKNDGKNLVNIAEEGYGFEHSMLLKNMEFSTIYTYRIEAKDKWGNKVNTEYFSAYTGDKSESIFDLITNAVEDVFGWAM